MKLIYLLLLCFLFGCAHFTPKHAGKFSILQGVTNSKEVEFSIVATKGREFKFELRSPDGTIVLPEENQKVEREFSDYVIHKLLFERDPTKVYNLFVFLDGKVVDQRLVGKAQTDPAKLRLAIASCLDDFYPEKFKIWDTLAEKNPDYLLLIGDNVYTNKVSEVKRVEPDPELIWKRYIHLRFTLPLYFQQKLIPTHAVWDDNDYGKNNSGSDFIYKSESKDIFEAFWAQSLAEENWTQSFGVSGLLSLGSYNLYFLDGRTYRSENSDGGHLGLDQTAWFLSKLREEATPSLIIKGDQFFGGYHPFESFERNHPKDFLSFITELKKINTPFIFISGDRHMSEIMQFPRSLFGKPSFEITSSPMHGRTFDKDNLNPWRVVAEQGNVNFTFIENAAIGNHWFLDVESIGENGEVYYRRELAVYIKDLQDNLNQVKRRRYGKRRYRRVKPRKRR